MNPKTLRLLKRSANDWPQHLKRLQGTKPGAMADVASELAALIQRAALLHAYVEHRYNTGCGEHNHVDSAKKANRMLVRVRRALGYTYPENVGIRIQP